MNVDELLLGLDRPAHQALPNGFNPWVVPSLERAPITRSAEYRRNKSLSQKKYWANKEPTSYICQECGEPYLSKVIHPTYWCSPACKDRVFWRERHTRRTKGVQ